MQATVDSPLGRDADLCRAQPGRTSDGWSLAGRLDAAGSRVAGRKPAKQDAPGEGDY